MYMSLNGTHKGQLRILKFKQRSRDLVWWPSIDCDIEALVQDSTVQSVGRLDYQS